MKSIQIQLTTKCNERCFMCRKYTWKHKEIDIEILKEKIAKYKNCTFTFSGGDPLAYSNLKDLNDILEENKITYQVFTNMNYDLDEQMDRLLSNAKFIQVSLDGSCSATYSSVRRCVENGFEKVISNINKYREKIKLNATISNRNYFDVKNIYIKFNEIAKLRFFPVHTDKDAMLEKFMLEHIKMQFEDFEEIPENVKLIFRTDEEFKGRCFVKREHRLIDESGKEYPCCRAINDNGEDWDGINCIENLEELDDENVLYDFCANCDRYRKFNNNWNEYKDKEELFL